MERRRALVTGAGGFIGRWSVAPLIARGYEVHAAVGRSAPQGAEAQLQGAIIHRADLLDPAAADALMGSVRPSHLLHFAWIATPGVYWTSPENFRWLAAGERLLRSFHAVGGTRVVMAGSCAEYDWSRVGICDERHSPLATGAAATTPYAACKIAMEALLMRFGSAHGLSPAWGRLFFQFGPHEQRERLVASVIVSLLQGREAPCTHGRQLRSFLHVADVGAAFAALLDSEVAGPVNIGSGEPITLADLLCRIATQIGRPDLVKLGARTAPPSEPPVLLPMVERLSEEVRWRPRFDLAAGIADTVDWWREALASNA